ncbi:MAG: hypothetical protein ACI9PP_002033 [Halobacteriales archaeon]|jgi:hypothetical protein
MEEAARSRRAAREAISDVDPEDLRETIDDILADGSMAPGALTLVCANALDETVGRDSLSERAAGVQLIYEGLRLTRGLAHEEPWARAEGPTQANVEVVAADILVSRGFYLLARTEAAEKAVETVRRFGRAQTDRQELSPGDQDGASSLDATLEQDVFELAAIAGAAAVGSDPSALVSVAAMLADAIEPPLEPAEECLPDVTVLRAQVTGPANVSHEEPRSWITDP